MWNCLWEYLEGEAPFKGSSLRKYHLGLSFLEGPDESTKGLVDPL